MHKFSSLDVYPKTLREFRERTLSGAVISIVCTSLIAILACIEMADFVRIKKHDRLFVDTSRGQQLRINLNISFPALPCSVISLDALDLSGNHAPDHSRTITKMRLDKKGFLMPPAPPTPPTPEPAARFGSGGRRLLFETHGGAAAAAGGGGAVADGTRGAGSVQHHEQKPASGQGGLRLLDGKLDTRQLGRPDVLLSKLLAELLPSVFDDKEARHPRLGSAILFLSLRLHLTLALRLALRSARAGGR